MSLKRIITTVGVLLLIGILIQVLFDPLSSAKHAFEISRVRAEFPNALAKWDAQKVTDYTFEIRGRAPLICSPFAIIEVKNDAVVKVETKDLSSDDSPAQLLSPERWADPDWGSEVFLCNYANFTITRIFNLLDRTLRNDPSIILQADFDPDYGFITKFSYGLFVGHGLLSPRISDCCSDFSIKNLKPLVPKTTQ